MLDIANLKEIKMNLFDAPVGSVLTHASNRKGVMGSGIAKVFKEKFPRNFEWYNYKMTKKSKESFILFEENGYYVANLITSNGFGKFVDSKEEILDATKIALNDLIDSLNKKMLTEVYSNKFNSGLFNVPWEETLPILEDVLSKNPHINWTVCDFP